MARRPPPFIIGTVGMEKNSSINMAANTQINNYDFALNLCRQIVQGESAPLKNIFFSPASISIVMAMCMQGGQGGTKSEIKNKIFGESSVDEDTLRWTKAVLAGAEGKNDSTFRLSFANRLYADQLFPIKASYKQSLVRDFQSEVSNVNFATNATVITKEINDWVAQVTNQRIKDLVPPGTLSADTVLVLINALYFKGAWFKQFESSQTKKKTFYTSQQKTVQIDMMARNLDTSYAENEKIQIVELTYDSSSVSMFVLLPKQKDGLKNFLTDLNGQKLKDLLSNMRRREIDLELPKFKIEQSFKLNDALINLGIKKAFNNEADFGAMLEPNAGRLQISKVLHKSFIEVDEKGTEAAAATFVGIALASAMISNDSPVKFVADHPFLFLLTAGRDENRAVLFMGQFYGP